MTKQEFQALPGLVMEGDVRRMGYARSTIGKLVDCGVLRLVRPAGTATGKYQKRQLAQLLGLAEVVQADEREWKQEPLLMRLKGVTRWTGYDPDTVAKLVAAGALRLVRPPSCAEGKYVKEQVGRLLGMTV